VSTKRSFVKSLFVHALFQSAEMDPAPGKFGPGNCAGCRPLGLGVQSRGPRLQFSTRAQKKTKSPAWKCERFSPGINATRERRDVPFNSPGGRRWKGEVRARQRYSSAFSRIDAGNLLESGRFPPLASGFREVRPAKACHRTKCPARSERLRRVARLHPLEAALPSRPIAPSSPRGGPERPG